MKKSLREQIVADYISGEITFSQLEIALAILDIEETQVKKFQIRDAVLITFISVLFLILLLK